MPDLQNVENNYNVILKFYGFQLKYLSISSFFIMSIPFPIWVDFFI